jgi:hypothetical protein
MEGQPPSRALPSDIAPEVAALAGDLELRMLARVAAAGPFECVAGQARWPPRPGYRRIE